jgi:hypothetical protein
MCGCWVCPRFISCFMTAPSPPPPTHPVCLLPLRVLIGSGVHVSGCPPVAGGVAVAAALHVLLGAALP